MFNNPKTQEWLDLLKDYNQSKKKQNIDEFLLDYFQKHGTLINQQDFQGRTSLHLAASLGAVEALKYLLKRQEFLRKESVNANLLSSNGRLAIQSALIMNEQTKHLGKDKEKVKACILALLPPVTNETDLKAAEVEANKKGGTPFLLEIRGEFGKEDPEFVLEVVKQTQSLLAIKNGQGENLLHRAIMSNQNELIAGLYKDYPDLTEQLTDNGSTIFHLACRYGNKETILQVAKICKDMYQNNPKRNLFFEIDGGIPQLRPLQYLDKRVAKGEKDLIELYDDIEEIRSGVKLPKINLQGNASSGSTSLSP